jgi:hypothetical protein
MKRYHYATIDSDTFLRASKVPLPGPNAYLAKDNQTDALISLMENGYRFVSLDSASCMAVFEKELPANNARDIIKLLNQRQIVRDLIAGVEQAIEHAQGKGWRSADVVSMLQNLIRKAKEANL